MAEQKFFAGISGVDLPVDSYDLGFGVTLTRAYAHLMSPHIMAFARAEAGKAHSPPWRAAKGGLSYDVTVQLSIASIADLPGRLSAEDTAWWIAALLRIVGHPYLAVPVLSDQPFSDAATARNEPDLRPFETVPRILRAGEDGPTTIADENLDWTKRKWSTGAEMLQRNPIFLSAIRAFDFCTLEGKRSLSLLSVWAGLEQLFSPSPGESRFRVSSNIAAYLEPPGEQRLALFKRILKLYDSRSKAAHTSSEIAVGPLVESFVIMRNVLVKIIDEESIPTQEVLERRLFCAN